MFDIEINANDLDEVVSDLDELARAISDLTEFWQDYVHPYLVDEVDLLFADEPWVPLNPKYAEQKARDFPGKTILRRTDRLYDSYIHGIEGLDLASSDSFIYGSEVPYAFNHEFGITPADGWGKLPQRAIIETLLEDREELESDIEEDLFTYLRRSSNLDIE